jgi:cytoskeletal protein CcmA (bactofilin family)
MFKNTSGMAKQVDLNSPDKLNRIVEGSVITGDFISESNIRIDGTVKGTIQTKGRLVVGANGKVEGDVVCQNAEIEGKVDGVIKVSELLTLKASARLMGDIYTSKLAIEPGATFNGNCNMGGASAKASNPVEQLKKEALAN